MSVIRYFSTNSHKGFRFGSFSIFTKHLLFKLSGCGLPEFIQNLSDLGISEEQTFKGVKVVTGILGSNRMGTVFLMVLQYLHVQKEVSKEKPIQFQLIFSSNLIKNWGFGSNIGQSSALVVILSE